MGKRVLGLTLLAGILVLLQGSSQGVDNREAGRIDLSGVWQFRMDREDVGITRSWFKGGEFSETIRLPGVLQAQGFGDEVTIDTPWTGDIVDRSWFISDDYEPYRKPGNIKVPFWLQPERYYKGPAWFQREVEIPSSWKGRRVVLTLERPHWETRVWLDGKPFGSNASLSTSHLYDLGTGVEPGKHRLTIRVDNRVIVNLGVNSHSISDHTQGNWNGIVGEVSLGSTPVVWIEDLQVYPDLEKRLIRVEGRLGVSIEAGGAGALRFRIRPFTPGGSWKDLSPASNVKWDAAGGSFFTELGLDVRIRPWDEFNPELYELEGILERPFHSKRVTFGFREVRTDGTQLILNGRKVFLRGTLECAIFPLTGHPPTAVESWRKVIRAAQAHGLNHIRFHSWCPPEAAFVAADELGFYFQVECGSWANQGATIGDGDPLDQWLYDEADRILEAYGNHPSFLLMLYGNEPGGERQKEYLGRWINHYRARDSRRLYSGGSGWPQIPENEFHVTPEPRIQAWGQGLKSRINARPPETLTDYGEYIQKQSAPVISHEIGQWCVFPNFEEMIKYRGYLKPRNFEIFRDRLAAHDLLDQARDFFLASGKLQALCYKEDIESALRTPGMGGFQLLDLHDFPGQGTALVGVLDPFWEEKGYIRPDEFRRFCNSTVPLARLEKRVFTAEEVLRADLEVAHFGPRALPSARAWWRVVNDAGDTIADGIGDPREVPIGDGTHVGRIELPLSGFGVPAKYRLIVGIQETAFENDWDFWVYPSSQPVSAPPEVLVVDELDSESIQALERGRIVFWMIPPAKVSGDQYGRVATGFSSIFWNTAWTQRQAPHTLGILCDPSHPALAGFPTEFHSNWQWWYLLHRGQAMILDGLPAGLRPIVQMIDDWFTSRKLGLVFEARVGRGKILVCSLDLRVVDGSDPVSRQMLHSLYSYVGSPEFNPEYEVELPALQSLFSSP